MAEQMDRVCSIPNCDKPAWVRGWCQAHYARWQRYGDPLGRPAPYLPGTCAVEGCGKSVYGWGWCKAHYLRWWRYGDPLGGKYTDGRRNHPLYTKWHGIIQRCHNERNKDYPRYGGRGTRVCDRWRNDFWAFVADLPMCPSPAHTLERIRNDKGYRPGKVTFATAAEQARNTRQNRRLTVGGRRQILEDWAKSSGIKRATIESRLKRGWTPEDAVTKPVRP
jgi:hypothetical protein